MLENDLVQVVVGASCMICVTPLVILWVTLRLVVGLERFLLRHSLLIWLFPITLWLRSRQEEDRESNQGHGDGCCHR